MVGQTLLRWVGAHAEATERITLGDYAARVSEQRPDEFGRLTERLREIPLSAKGARDYSRVFFASAHDDVPDKQGRVTVPGPLRDYAGLERECVVIGANTRVEIWDTAAWNAYLTGQEEQFASLSEEVLPGIF